MHACSAFIVSPGFNLEMEHFEEAKALVIILAIW